MESPGRVLSLQSIADHIGGSGVCDVTKEYIASAVERKEASEQVVLHQASTYSDLLARAEMSSLFNKRLQETAIFIFKIKKNFFFYKHIRTFSWFTGRLQLRMQSTKFRFIFSQDVESVAYGKHSLRIFRPYLWSKLNISDSNETSLKRFKETIYKE